MLYEKIVHGRFIDRPNRFIAHVEIEGKIETVHVKNTGRCKELLLPGSLVILEDFRGRQEGELRKTKFDLVAVYKALDDSNPLKEYAFLDRNQAGSPDDDGIWNPDGKILINMDSQAPNKVVGEWLSSLPQESRYDYVKPEYTFGDSRVDFYMEKNGQKYLMEVKGCTLEKDGMGYFPDAPTERGVKHLKELALASGKGYRCFLAFVIQVPGVTCVLPNNETHLQFGEALKEAVSMGVEVLYLPCMVTEEGLSIVTKNDCSGL